MDLARLPIHMAVQSGSVQTVHLLAAAGADINVRNNKHATPIGRAVGKMQLDIVEVRLPSLYQNLGSRSDFRKLQLTLATTGLNGARTGLVEAWCWSRRFDAVSERTAIWKEQTPGPSGGTTGFDKSMGLL
jgi:ankyrin repeat protein